MVQLSMAENEADKIQARQVHALRTYSWAEPAEKDEVMGAPEEAWGDVSFGIAAATGA